MTTRRAKILAEPWSADLLDLLRDVERGARDKPRIGENLVLAQEPVRLGQDPYAEFPASNISAITERPDSSLNVRTRFLGYFGPQGALPLATTMEAYNWQRGNDSSFVAFADLFATRFLQLFFRAWSNARPITQADRPEHDRFRDYVGSFIGIGVAAFHDRDAVDDVAKLRFAGLLSGRVKSATRLRQILTGLLGLDVEVEERIGHWLEFEPGDRSRLGQAGATLGQNTYLGARVFSVETKARLKLRAKSFEEYQSFLPGGQRFQHVSDMIRLYLGDTIDIDVELGLPRNLVPAGRLGVVGQLGWTLWSAPTKGGDDEYVSDAVFSTVQAVPAQPSIT